jgi:hypothetical protein
VTAPLPIPPGNSPASLLGRLTDIPGEEIRFANQKRARTPRAYRRDVCHFIAAFGTGPVPPRTSGSSRITAASKAVSDVCVASRILVRRPGSAAATTSFETSVAFVLVTTNKSQPLAVVSFSITVPVPCS